MIGNETVKVPCFLNESNLIKVFVLDTGAKINCISEKMWEEISEGKETQPTKFSIRTANNEEMKCLGTVRMNVRIGRKKWNDTFFVLKSLTYPLIMGLPTMEREKVNIYLGDKYVTIGTDKAKINFIGYPEKIGQLHIIEAIELPTACQTLLVCKISRSKTQAIEKETAIVSQRNNLNDQKGIRVGKGLTNIKNNHAITIVFAKCLTY